MGLFSKDYERSLKKPYLKLVAKDLEIGKSIKFLQKKVVVKKTVTIKAFIKAVDTNNQRLIDKILKTDSNFNYIFEDKSGQTYKWNEIDKMQYSGATSKVDAVSTGKQETASLFSISTGLTKNLNSYGAWSKVCASTVLDIYPEADESWMRTFYEQQKRVRRELGSGRYETYDRDSQGGFMDWITKLVSSNYGISKKDNWNPADIWLINKESVVRKQLDELAKGVKGGKGVSLEIFNAKMRELYKDRLVVGISLKKMSGTQANWEEVNTSGFTVKKTFNIGKYKMLLSGKRGIFDNQDTTIFIHEDNKLKIRMQIKANGSGFSNLKYEITLAEAGAARAGKAPVDMVKTIAKEYGLNFENDHKKYPKTAAEFEKVKDEYQAMFDGVVDEIESGIKSEEFYKKMIMSFNSKKPEIATTKLMQLRTASEILSLAPDMQHELITRMSFAAEKKGDVFGPFAKLY